MNFFDIKQISNNLLKRSDVKWFFDISKSAKFLSEDVKLRICKCAERWNGYKHPPLDNYDEYFQNKNRCNFEDRYINRRNHLIDIVFYEYFFSDGRYITDIEYLVKMICEEPTWCVPAHKGSKPPIDVCHVIELYASETGAVLSLTYKLLCERLTKNTNGLIKSTVKARILDAYLESDDYGWMGTRGQRVNNWNPWINSNIIICALAVCDDEELYRKLVLRACELSENYVRSVPDDGLCDEGVRYWNLSTACLYDIVELVYDITGGAVDLTKNEKLRNACEYILGMYSEYGDPANFSDAGFDFYPDCPLLVRIGKRSDMPLLGQFGEYLYRPEQLRSIHDNFYRQLKNLYTASEIIRPEKPALLSFTILKGINIATFRKNGLFTAFKGNHNGESHNHNDVGSFVVYKEKNPVFIDPGVELYSGYTFDKERFKLWYMRSDYHNLPQIGGKIQCNGKHYSATPLICSEMHAECDISGAYGLSDRKWLRSVDHLSDELVISDKFDYSDDETYFTLIMRTKPDIDGNILKFPFGVTAIIENAKDIRIEEFDISGKNPPDGIIGDADNRVTDGYSVLIPTLLTTQWEQDNLYRLLFSPTCGEVKIRIF